MNKIKLFSICDSLFEQMVRIEKNIAMFFLACIVGLIIYQVIARSIFHIPLSWAEEMSTYLFIWITFIGASITYKQGSHIVIKTFVNKCPFLLKTFIQFSIYACIIVASTMMIESIYKIVIPTEMKSFSTALPIKLPKAFFFSFPLLFTIINILIYTIYIIFKQIYSIIIQKEV